MSYLHALELQMHKLAFFALVFQDRVSLGVDMAVLELTP